MLGTRHCFNDIADSRHALISLKPMDRVVALDPQARTVTVEAGMSYGQLCPYLHEQGFALHNLASLPHISVAGACATATHGSGIRNGNLATAVSALELVTADGDVLTLSRDKDGDTFLGAVVNLGALGVVTRVTLDVQPAFAMRQDVYEDLPLAQLDGPLREHRVERLQRQPVHRLAGRTDQRGVGQAPRRGRGAAGGQARVLWGEARDQESPPDRRALGGELHGADGGAGPLV